MSKVSKVVIAFHDPFNEEARRGQRIFQQQGCAGCHIPPLYTNNRLTPAAGFQVPEELRKTDQILDISVGTDPTLAMRTRRGTGFYKVPSLRGVWYYGYGKNQKRFRLKLKSSEISESTWIAESRHSIFHNYTPYIRIGRSSWWWTFSGRPDGSGQVIF
jgi:hypothetical protein